MNLSRRQFNSGAAALSGAAAMPPIPLPLRSGYDDAYTALISELARVEEAAHATGAAGASCGGAVTATGRQLEAFIGHLDMQVSPLEAAGQVYGKLRKFLKKQAEEIARETKGAMKRVVSEKMERSDDERVMRDAVPVDDDEDAARQAERHGAR